MNGQSPRLPRAGTLVFSSLRPALLVWAGVGIVLALAGCEKPAGMTLPPPVVQVLEVTETNVPRSVEFIGQLDSPQSVDVRARVEGFLDSYSFIEGMPVEKGQVLFELDKKPFEERLAGARGALAEANAALKKYEADVARLAPLAKAKAIPQQDLDNAEASVDVGKANVESAEARVKSAELDLGYCTIYAPVSGLIGALQVPVGSLVGRGQATLLATISELDPIWFYCAISDVDYLSSRRAAEQQGRQLGELPVTLITPDGSEHPQPGKWVFLDRAVDAKTGTLRARAEFPNPGGVLRPGMFGRLRVTLRGSAGSILAPERAIVELQGKTFVWVVGPDKKAAQRNVRIAPQRFGMDAIVVSGLRPGELVVIEGLQKVFEGATVQPMTAEQLAAAKAKAAAAAPGGAGAGKKE